MKAAITAIALVASSTAHAIPEVESVPPEKIVKTWTATVTLSGYDEALDMVDVNSVTIIEGFRSNRACQEEAHRLGKELMSSLKKTGGKWDNARVGFGCHTASGYLPKTGSNPYLPAILKAISP